LEARLEAVVERTNQPEGGNAREIRPKNAVVPRNLEIRFTATHTERTDDAASKRDLAGVVSRRGRRSSESPVSLLGPDPKAPEDGRLLVGFCPEKFHLKLAQARRGCGRLDRSERTYGVQSNIACTASFNVAH
jgi:hypothetical protein